MINHYDFYINNIGIHILVPRFKTNTVNIFF